MGRRQLLAITLWSLGGLGSANMSASAGWFGPSNYQECVLGEMKGQPAYMLPNAEKACALRFPCPDAYHKTDFDAFVSECHSKMQAYSASNPSSNTPRDFGTPRTVEDWRAILPPFDICPDEAKSKFCPDR